MKPLNELEKKMFAIICDCDYEGAEKHWVKSSFELGKRRARAAAQVAIDLARRAYVAGQDYEWDAHFGAIPNTKPDLKAFLESEGITE